MPTINVSTIAGDASPCVQLAEDLGAGSADNVSGKILALHRHDAIYKAAWDDLHGVDLVKNYISTTVSTSGDNTVIAAPGSGNTLSIPFFSIENESATEVTVILKSGATNRYRAVLSPKSTAGSFRIVEMPLHMPLSMAVNEALVVNISGAFSVGINVAYFVRG
jgi:hypothetical protein